MSPKRSGFTLVEVLVATVLVSLVFITAASLYLTALKFFKTASSGETPGVNIEHRIALASMAGPVSSANLLVFESASEFQLDPKTKGYRQFKARVDNPKFTLFDKNGDAWYSYGLVPVDKNQLDGAYALRWKKESGSASFIPVDVTGKDSELVQGLLLDKNAAFIKIDPTSSGRSRIVRVLLIKDAANPENSIQMDIAAEAMTK